MRKILITIFFISFFSISLFAQQYWHRVKGGCGNIGASESVVSLMNDTLNHLLYVGGNFNKVDDTILCSGAASWNGISWDSITVYNSNPATKRLVMFHDTLFVGASNGSIGGLSKHISGSTWQLISYTNGDILSLCVYHNKLYAGGEFTDVDGMPASFIACYDGTNWSEPGGGVWCTQFPGDVKAMCVWNDKLIVGGSFDQAGGQSVHSVVAWNDTTWSDVGGGVFYVSPTNVAYVNALCVHDSDLFVGGSISHGGGTLPVNNICGWNGNNWFALGGGVNNGSVNCLLSFDSSLYVGGLFSNANWVSNTQSFAKWDGANWFSVGGSISSQVFCIAVYDSIIYAGGSFSHAANIPVNNIARLLDFPDTTNYDAVKEISESENEIKIFPNPAQNQVTVSELKQGDEIQVSDITGRVLIQTTESIINVSYLSSGIYLLEIKTKDGKRMVKKFVKE